jgi:polyhydroxyalkanoate synthesis regulator protein
MEEENGGQTMLPINFLRQLIAMYGGQMQAMLPHYLDASMSAFAENQAKFRDAAIKPFEQLTKQNLAMFQAAAEMWTGGARKRETDMPAAGHDELQALKAQVAALQARLDKIGQS